MDLKDQVVSLKYAKKLKELGFEQNSVWSWANDYDANYCLCLSGSKTAGLGSPLYSAYTVAELGEMLPSKVCWRGYANYNNKWSFEFGDFKAEDNTEANARAKMLIYLKENNLI